MVRTLTAEAVNRIDQAIFIQGWVNSRRDHGKVIFIDVRDRSGILQVVCDKTAGGVGPEDVVEIEGIVKKRPAQMVNPDIITGQIELQAHKLNQISKSKTPPFDVGGDALEIEEAVRLKYRYLDLRRPRLTGNLRLRHKVISAIRHFLDRQDFVEIETPILTKATPEGARDFVVPSRLQPGKFYALPQSPQQYKQLLMVAGFERYYQIARCFRDEDPRADRAYGEFTQLDVEMSFASQDDILTLIEQLLIHVTEQVIGKRVLQKPFPRLTYRQAIDQFGDDKFDLRASKDPQTLAFAWVVDFPLFEKTPQRQITSAHHPFTAPKEEDIPLLDTDPFKTRSWQHDLVCNGFEIGGGSLRIVEEQLQKKIFTILGHSPEEVEKKFGHLLGAFNFGVPPHGGIALGIERLLMILTGERNTRETVAFPMSSSGQTSVMDAPSEIDPNDLKVLGIKVG